ncbi:hypothetical protein H4R19_000605 [Coemansia spiralis]|nr:hypothetical protein H4R19_000605 [Coemansia spiralis]
MHINDLPDDILEPVLCAALPATKHRITGLVGGLELLSVCKRWRVVALPVVYNTVFFSCGIQSYSSDSGPTSRDIKSMVDLVVGAKCLHVVKKIMIYVNYRRDALPGLKAVIDRICEAADAWTGVRNLELNFVPFNWTPDPRIPLVADYESDIDSATSAFAALMPGLHRIKIVDIMQTQVTCELFGRLIGLYSDQLQVLHSSHALAAPQDRVFGKLKDLRIDAIHSGVLDCQLPRLNPEVVESLVLKWLTTNDMWSMFCNGPDEHAITFPRLTNLRLVYPSGRAMSPEQSSRERPWALRFPAAKRVRIICDDGECPSMANAVFPTNLESLDVNARLDLLQAIAGAKTEVSQSLVLHTSYASGEDSVKFDTINRIFAAAGQCRSRALVITNAYVVPLELFTYTGLTHLRLRGPASVDQVMHHIRTQPQLSSLDVANLIAAETQTDITIPMRGEHELVAPLDTKIRALSISTVRGHDPEDLLFPMLKYLLLTIATLRHVVAHRDSKQLRRFVEKYVQLYPHLANPKVVESPGNTRAGRGRARAA